VTYEGQRFLGRRIQQASRIRRPDPTGLSEPCPGTGERVAQHPGNVLQPADRNPHGWSLNVADVCRDGPEERHSVAADAQQLRRIELAANLVDRAQLTRSTEFAFRQDLLERPCLMPSGNLARHSSIGQELASGGEAVCSWYRSVSF
jgi:hypothetical protein